ncbi:MAG: peptidoglycan-binding protein [Aestuariivirga sp.]|nr:peptidoglycan-binding protein [Aestuariivirga sp.]
MKPGIPWSVKGIEPETREAAKDAARRSGMTLGEWLNSKILDSAEEHESAPAARHQRATPARAETSIRLEDIAEQLARIARREQNTAPASYGSESRLEDEENLSRILNRIESNERQTVEAFTAVNERLAVLSRQVLQTAKMPTISKPEEPAAFKSLETAMRNIVEHIEISERRTRDSLKSMQDRMAEMAQRANSSTSEQVLQSAPAFTSLEFRLNELSSRVERSENKSDAGLSNILREELAQLTDRIETVRESAEVLASKAQTAAVQTSQAELREIEQRILKLLKEAQTAFSGQGGNSSAEMQRLRSEVGLLNQRIDSARTETASERDVHALRVALEQLSTRVAQGPDMRPLADMDKRLVDITQRLEQSQQSALGNPQLGDLERRMAELDHRLNDALQAQGDGQSQLALEQKIAEVADRVGQTEHQLGHLETIERAINQLFDSVEQSREWSKDMAEDAASRMADRLMNAPGAAPLMPGSSPELQALEEGLQAVRESALSADTRNQETLRAVHDTLEQIVTKLAELETAAVGQQVAAAAQSNPFATPEPGHLESLKEESQPAQSMPESPESEPELILESPVKPVVEAQAPVESNPLTDWLSNSTLPGGEPPLPDEADAASDDFIMAARRAAQASAQKSILASLAPSAKSARKYNLPFLKSAAKPTRQIPSGEKLPPEIKPAINKNSSKRRTLVLAGLVLLAAVTAFTFNMLNKPQKSTSTVPAAPIEGTVQPGAPAMQSNAVTPAAAPESQLLVEKTTDTLPQENSDGPNSIDEILTGSLQNPKTDATLASIVAEPGTTAGEREMPPPELGSQELRSAAENGDASAQFIVATRFLDGEGVTQDVTRAAHWYQKAALAGLAPAQYRLATLFERGRGVPKDSATALIWYERAAAQGNVKAMHNAAVIAAGTEAGNPNYDTAYKWFLAASQNGLKDSQFNLAVLYERALGTKANVDEALFWYLVAASQDDADARKRAEVLAQNLSPLVVEAVRAKARAWVPQRPPEDANVVTIQDASWQSPASLTQIMPSTPAVEKQQSTTEDPIGEAQQLLNKLGFNIGEPDGRMGVRTTNAIRLFQLQYGLKVTGEVTADLINQLQARTSSSLL